MEASPNLSVERIRLAIQSRINPIRNLSPERLSLQMDQFQRGYFRDFALLGDRMINRDPIIKSVLGKREKSVARQSFEILTTEDSAKARKHKEALTFFYNNLTVSNALEQDERGGLSLLLRQMQRAEAMRYAVHEIVLRPGRGGELTAHFISCPLWFFEGHSGKLRFLKSDFATDGVEMADGEWLVTVGEGLMESLAIAYMFKWMSLKDWVNFNEKFGFPIPIGETDGKPGSEQWRAMEQAVRSICNDSAAVTNKGDKITLLEVKNTGSSLPFPPLVEYMDRVIATLVRGGDLGTISKGNDAVGASLQEDETDLLTEDDCQARTENLNANIDPLVTHYLFKEQPLAYIKISPPKKQNVDQDIKIDNHLVSHGARLSIPAAAERFGRELADDKELKVMEKAAVGAPSQSPALANDAGKTTEQELVSNSLNALAAALPQDMHPLIERILGILELQDTELFFAAWRKLQADLPELGKGIKDVATASVFEGANTAALINGLVQGAVDRSKAK